MTITHRALGLSAAATTAAALSGCSFFNRKDEAPVEEKSLVLLIDAFVPGGMISLEDDLAVFTKMTGTQVSVQVATDLEQDIAASLASSTPADVFHLTPEVLATYAEAGALWAYGDQFPEKDDIFPCLVEAGTYKDKFYGVATAFSTLALFINTDLWREVGLSEGDIPTTWEELEQVASRVAGGEQAGLVLSAQYDRLGVFMAQAGGGITDAEGNIIANSAGSVAGLNQVKAMLNSGAAVFATSLDASSGGEAFAARKALMTIETGRLTELLGAQFPEFHYQVVELPAGPAGKRTLQFSHIYGIPDASARKMEAMGLVQFLTSYMFQRNLVGQTGAMPTLKSGASAWQGSNPTLDACLAGADYAVGLPVLPGIRDVMDGLDAQLSELAQGDPQAILDDVQANLEAMTA